MKVSICIPFYDEMPNSDFFLKRCLKSVEAQSFKDYEIVITTDKGGWAANHNAAIKKSQGELIKFLHMDDFFYVEFALREIVGAFKGDWLVTGCIHYDGVQYSNPHPAKYSQDIHTGNNTIGGPSVLTIKNDEPLLFDETLSWMVDCDYYKRLYDKFGEPTVLGSTTVVIGLHQGQATRLIPNEQKIKEVEYVKEKY